MLSVPEAAKELGVDPETIRWWGKAGKITIIRTSGRTTFVSNQDIQKMKDEISMSRKLKKYNLTEEEYSLLRDKNKGLCEICNQLPDKECVDHDHNTGTVRGLLCNNCNSGLGFLKDNVNLLVKATEYLRRHETLNTEDEDINVYYYGAKKGVLPT